LFYITRNKKKHQHIALIKHILKLARSLIKNLFKLERDLQEKLVLLEREDILDHQGPLESKVFPELLAKKVERYGVLNTFTSDHSRLII